MTIYASICLCLARISFQSYKFSCYFRWFVVRPTTHTHTHIHAHAMPREILPRKKKSTEPRRADGMCMWLCESVYRNMDASTRTIITAVATATSTLRTVAYRRFIYYTCVWNTRSTQNPSAITRTWCDIKWLRDFFRHTVHGWMSNE